MCIIIRGHEKYKYHDLMEHLFRLRHQIFVEERKWSIPSYNGREIDQYDTDEAVYFINLASNGSIEGSVRMTPSLRSSLLADYFPHLVETGEAPRGPAIYEATRYFVRPMIPTRTALRAAKVRLLVPLFEWCLKEQLEQFQAVIDYGALGAFTELSPMTRVLGAPQPFAGGPSAPGGGHCIAARWPVSQAVIDDIKAYAKTGHRNEASHRQHELAPAH